MRSFEFYMSDDFETQIEHIFDVMSNEFKLPGKKMSRFLITKIKATRAKFNNMQLERWA